MSSGTLRVLVVDDDPIMRQLVRAWLDPAECEVAEASTAPEALAAQGIDVYCLDLGLGAESGAQLLRDLKQRDPEVTAVVATATRDVEAAVDVMRLGAYDFLTKPLDRRRFLAVMQRALERAALLRRARPAADSEPGLLFGRIVGRSAPILALARQVENVLESDISVCIHGESGTGKELVARAIHERGRRARGPYVALNCAAIPAALQESELFGHERGAFTGAVGTHKGRFEQAHGGTLFLDEIGEMSASTQAALLRTLQEKTIRRVGGSTEVPVNVRVVCATHRDLEAEVRAGRFREDLYFRLVGYPLEVPPLRDRSDDIPLLVGHLLRTLRADVGREVSVVASDALEALSRYRWPGNVRELQNVVHRAMLACGGTSIELSHLPPTIRQAALPPPTERERPSEPDAEARSHSEPVSAPSERDPSRSARADEAGEEGVIPLKELERRAIAKALQVTGGSVAKAAKLLGLGRATLYRRLTELQLVAAVRDDAAADYD